MSHADTAAGGIVAKRPTASRKLLSRKAAEKAAEGVSDDNEALEDSFPRDDGGATDQAPQPISDADDAKAGTCSAELPAPHSDAVPEGLAVEPAAAATTPAQPATAPLWSEADESAFQQLVTRRKAAGYQRRGRSVGGQLLRVGEVVPNSGTVAAVVAALVAERETVSRGDLVAAMATATFPHPKARPSDRGWCQGYVAGCVRDGFLAEVAASQADAASGTDAAGAGAER